MFHFAGDTIDQLFVAAIESVIANGAVVSPRGIETREVFPASFELRNPRARVLLVEGRRINPAFAIAEALWILSGSEAPWIFDYNSKLKQYANDGILRGAYGPRLRNWCGQIDQLDNVRRTLRDEPTSRRAIIQIYDPGSVAEGHLDIPCTISHHFLIRDGCLHLFTTMRGQDLWLGLPYDIFYNTVLQELMAGWIGVPIGSYYYHADSLHLYAHDMPSARSLSTNRPGRSAAMTPIHIEWEQRDELIAAILGGSLPRNHSLATLAMTLESYRHWKSGSYSKAADLAAAVGGPLGNAARLWYSHLSSLMPQTGPVAPEVTRA